MSTPEKPTPDDGSAKALETIEFALDDLRQVAVGDFVASDLDIDGIIQAQKALATLRASLDTGDTERMDWLEKQTVWIGMTEGWDGMDPSITAGAPYRKTVRDAVDDAIRAESSETNKPLTDRSKNHD